MPSYETNLIHEINRLNESIVIRSCIDNSRPNQLTRSCIDNTSQTKDRLLFKQLFSLLISGEIANLGKKLHWFEITVRENYGWRKYKRNNERRRRYLHALRSTCLVT